MNNNPIAIYDSGIGGLQTLKLLSELAPLETYYYYSDNENMPYGNKTYNKLKEIATNKIIEINKISPKAIILACNTLSTNFYNYLAEKTDSKLFCIMPMAKMINSKNKTLLVCTSLTAKSKYVSWLKMVYPNLNVKPLDSLATNIENSIIYKSEVNFDLEMDNISKDYDDVVLACTHYKFIQRKFQDYFYKSSIIDPNYIICKEIIKSLPLANHSKPHGKILVQDKNVALYKEILANNRYF